MPENPLRGQSLRAQLQSLVSRHPGIVGLTLAEMVAAGRYDGVSAKFATVGFRVVARRFTSEGARLFAFDEDVTPGEVATFLHREGMRLACVERLLAFGRDFPDIQRAHPVIGRTYDGQLTPFLTGDFSRRDLYVGVGQRRAYRPTCRFLAAPESAV